MAIQLKRKHGSFEQSDIDQLIEGQPAIDLDSGTMVVGNGKGDVVIVGSPQVTAEASLREEGDTALQTAIEDEAAARLELQEKTYSRIVDESTGEEIVTITRSPYGNFAEGSEGKARIDNQLVRLDFTWDSTHESGHKGQDQSHRMFSDYEYYRLTTGDEDIVNESGEVDKVNGRKLAFNTLIWPALTSFSGVQTDYKNNKTDYELVTDPNDSNYNKYLKQINIRYPSKGGTLALESDNPWLPGSGSGSVILGKGLASPPNATGPYSIAVGSETLASARYSFAHGIQSEASGDYSAAFNYKSKSSGPNSFSANNGKATMNLSAAFGKATADAQCQFAIGDKTIANSDALLKVGNNKSTNAFEVLADGRATVQSAPQNNIDVVRKLELDSGINNLKSEFTNTTDTLTGRLDNITIPGVLYSHRDGTTQTSTIMNGRLKCSSEYGLWAETDPGGFAARRWEKDGVWQQTYLTLEKLDTDVHESSVGYNGKGIHNSLFMPDVEDGHLICKESVMKQKTYRVWQDFDRLVFKNDVLERSGSERVSGITSSDTYYVYGVVAFDQEQIDKYFKDSIETINFTIDLVIEYDTITPAVNEELNCSISYNDLVNNSYDYFFEFTGNYGGRLNGVSGNLTYYVRLLSIDSVSVVVGPQSKELTEVRNLSLVDYINEVVRNNVEPESVIINDEGQVLNIEDYYDVDFAVTSAYLQEK